MNVATAASLVIAIYQIRLAVMADFKLTVIHRTRVVNGQCIEAVALEHITGSAFKMVQNAPPSDIYK